LKTNRQADKGPIGSRKFFEQKFALLLSEISIAKRHISVVNLKSIGIEMTTKIAYSTELSRKSKFSKSYCSLYPRNIPPIISNEQSDGEAKVIEAIAENQSKKLRMVSDLSWFLISRRKSVEKAPHGFRSHHRTRNPGSMEGFIPQCGQFTSDIKMSSFHGSHCN
jgi:hypothetical protein